jgi:hypothetical protein
LMVIFCKNGTLSARGIVKKIKNIIIKMYSVLESYMRKYVIENL